MNARLKTACVSSALAALACASPAAGQPAAAPSAKTRNIESRSMIVDELVDNARRNLAVASIQEPFGATIANTPTLLMAYLVALRAERAGYRELLDAMEAHSDKQVGATSNASGSTSLALKGIVPQILGVAVERGALNENVKGTTLTFRATPAGIVKALQGSGLAEIDADYRQQRGYRFASRFSAAASFDTSLGDTPGTFSGDARQLSAWSVRVEVVNRRNPASLEYAALFAKIAAQSGPYVSAASSLRTALTSAPAFAAFEAALVDAIRTTVDEPYRASRNEAAAVSAFRALLEARLSDAPALTDARVSKALDAYVAELMTIQQALDEVYAFANRGALVTVDWSTTRNAALPDLYAPTVIWQQGIGPSRKTDLTVNGTVNFYRATPAGAQRQLKSVDLTAQIDHPLGPIVKLPPLLVSIAARYGYIPTDTVSSATAAANTAAAAAAGSIAVLQAKLTIPVRNSGVKIPLSITASNRTELIKEKDVRASIGLTLDLDAIAAALAPSR